MEETITHVFPKTTTTKIQYKKSLLLRNKHSLRRKLNKFTVVGNVSQANIASHHLTQHSYASLYFFNIES